MRDALLKRLDELISSSRAVLVPEQQFRSYANDEVAAQSWFTSAAHAVRSLCPASSAYVAEVESLLEIRRKLSSTELASIRRMIGILQAVKADAAAGILQSAEDVAFATAFDEFLDHAQVFHKGGKIPESAVLVSAVLEDAIKRIGLVNNVPVAGLSLEQIVDDLVKAGVLTLNKAKRVRGYAAVRNSALHAEWGELDLRDIGQAITGVRDLLDEFLGG